MERVERALLEAPEAWIPGAAERAGDHGSRLLAEVGFGSAIRLDKQVAIGFGQPIRLNAKTSSP